MEQKDKHRLAHSRPSQADATSGETRLREALERIANDPYQHGQRVQKMKAIARAALTAPPTSDAGEARQAMLDTARQLRENSNGDPSAIQQAIAWERRAATLSPPTSGEEMRLREENARLRAHIAASANSINAAGSAYDEAIAALDRLVAETKSSARAALTKGADRHD